MKSRCKWSGVNSNFSQPAFLLAEACIALFIVLLASQVLFYCIGQAKSAQRQVERRADRAYASYILRRTDLSTIQAHGHVYRLAGQKIADLTEGRTYEVK